MRKIHPLTTLIVLLLTTTASLGQGNPLWTRVAEPANNQGVFANRQRPDTFAIFHLDEKSFRQQVSTAPSEKRVKATSSGFTISFPLKNGETDLFRIVEASVMDPALAAKYPGINSYAGTSVRNPAVTVRFDVTPEGIHAMILSPKEQTTYIDPVGNRSEALYKVVPRSATGERSLFNCTTPLTDVTTSAVVAKPGSADDGKLRTYRLALCSSLEFSQFFLNGTETTDAQRKAKVLAALVTIMTRSNAIFERDFSLRLSLVANNDQLISVSAADNPWATGDLNAKTQQICDSRIGDANYDIGHLLNLDEDNGNAGAIGSVCVSGTKGSAFTSYSDPGETEHLVVDFLTHEMGHQLGANHTFSVLFESTIAQVEPGSGSTIMGYAGITDADVQQHSDDYFSAMSIQQVTDYIKTGVGSFCAQETSTGNAAPVVSGGANYIIPHSTPFTLTGSATDANNDALTYTWEQLDKATGTTPKFPTTTSPGAVFRSFPPTTTAFRNFPGLASILGGTNTNTWEKLPSVSRILNFRLTVRDNHAGGGGNSFDDVTVQFVSSIGPFRVTTANTATTIDELSTQTITWNVAGSNAGVVNCALVNILLSRDGGQTFPVTLISATANDGSEQVVIPAGVTTTARIKIQAVGNIFFDINDANFTIKVPPCAPQITSAPVALTRCTGSSAAFTVDASGSSLGYTWQVSTDGVNYVNAPGANTGSTYNITNVQTVLNNTRYRVIVSGGCLPTITSVPVLLTVVVPPSFATSGNPQSQVTCETGTTSFSAGASGDGILYQWQVSNNQGTTFTDLAAGSNYSGTNTSTLGITNTPFAMNNNQYRVAIYNSTCTDRIYSTPASLTVNPRPLVTLQAAPLTSILPGQSTTLTAAIAEPSEGFSISWYRDSLLLPDATGTTYLVDSVAVGEYKVRIDNPVTGCSNESPVVAITTTASSRLFVFPNPNNGQFTISYFNSSRSSTRQEVVIYDSRGSRVFKRVLNVAGPYSLSTINITGFSKGVYYVVIGDSGGKKLADSRIIVH
ncbi:MAG: reprolysin-like metallopeptidase [Chitinophagaceae bacterium]